MRERLAAFAQGLSRRITPVAAKIGSKAAAAHSTIARWFRIAAREIVRFSAAAAAFSARVAGAVLLAIETTLLSARGRERIHAASVFALIFAFAVTSVDMLVTGGPDVISSAQAASAPSPRVDLIAATSVRDESSAPIQLAALDTAPPQIEANFVETVAPLAMTPAAALPSRPSEPLPALLDAPPVKADADEAAAAISAADAKIKDDETEA